MSPLEFPRLLQLTRRQAGYASARQFANALEINENRYTRYERGEAEPSLALLSRICTLLGTTPNQLLGFSESSRPESGGASDRSASPAPRTRGFEDQGPSGYDAQSPSGTLAADRLIWRFSQIYVAETSKPPVKSKRGATASAPVSAEDVARLYVKLRTNAISGLASLLTQETYARLPAATKAKLEPLIEDIIAATSEVPDRTAAHRKSDEALIKAY